MLLRIFIRYTHDSREHVIRMRERSRKPRNSGSVGCRIEQHEEARPRGLR